MRHVDDGTLHAWLDRQVIEPGEAAWIEEHLRDCAECRARLDEERATVDQAESLLAMAAPAGDRPAFDTIVARANATTTVSATDGTDSASVAGDRGWGSRRWVIPASWAASVALAVALGWTAREFSSRDASPPAEVRQAQAPVDGTTDTIAGTRSMADLLAPPRAEPAPAEAATAVGAQPAAPAPAGDDRSRFEAPSTAPTVATSERAANEEQKVAPGSPALEPGGRQAPPAEAPAPPSPADASVRPGEQAEPLMRAPGAAAPPPERMIATPAPAAVPSDLTDRTAAGGRVGMARAAASVLTDAQVEAIEWRTVPRTEAAARSGMPLYGIDGVEPALTTVSVDGRAVRTVYRLESGDTVELVQHRVVDETVPGVSSVQTMRRAPSVAARAAEVAREGPDPRVWTGVRADVRLTLSAVSDSLDLDALGARLQVD
jgi:hypothetical protein